MAEWGHCQSSAAYRYAAYYNLFNHQILSLHCTSLPLRLDNLERSDLQTACLAEIGVAARDETYNASTQCRKEPFGPRSVGLPTCCSNISLKSCSRSSTPLEMCQHSAADKEHVCSGTGRCHVLCEGGMVLVALLMVIYCTAMQSCYCCAVLRSLLSRPADERCSYRPWRFLTSPKNCSRPS